MHAPLQIELYMNWEKKEIWNSSQALRHTVKETVGTAERHSSGWLEKTAGRQVRRWEVGHIICCQAKVYCEETV